MLRFRHKTCYRTIAEFVGPTSRGRSLDSINFHDWTVATPSGAMVSLQSVNTYRAYCSDCKSFVEVGHDQLREVIGGQ